MKVVRRPGLVVHQKFKIIFLTTGLWMMFLLSQCYGPSMFTLSMETIQR